MTTRNDDTLRLLEELPSARHLRIFEAVARLESVTKAATEVRLSQPAVTQAIAKLESDVGRQLLERRATGTYPTPFGAKYLDRTRRFFHHIETALAEISVPDDKAHALGKAFRITRSQTRCHVMIARSHSFAQAATEVGISQASLHRAARDLELNLGVSLYRNSASGIITTEAGKVLARGLLRSINEMQSAAEELSVEGTVAPTSIAVGVQMLDPAPFLAGVMGAFTRAAPDSTIRMVSSTYQDLRRRMNLGLLDMMVGVLQDEGDDLKNEALFRDPYFVAARRGHPLAGQDMVTAEQLLEYDWVVANPGAPRRFAFDYIFRNLGRKPRTSIVSHSYATIRATVSESDRLAILTQSELLLDEKLGVFTRLRTEPVEPTPVIGLTTRADWLPTQRQQAFLTLLREHGAAMGRPL